MQAKILILLILLSITVTYSLISLYTPTELEYSRAQVAYSPKENFRVERSSSNGASQINTTINDIESLPRIRKIPNKVVVSDVGLPYSFTVVGIGIPLEEQNYNNDDDSVVLIQFENELFEHQLHDFILNKNMQLVKIDPQEISVIYDDVIYKIALTPPNILADDFKTPEKMYAELINMSANEIGSRPRIMEHLIKLTPTPYIANGAIVGPGLNPLLFEQAGFLVDDVLKSINGKSVTIDAELEDIKEELKTAQTLTFAVVRKGRLITLYLDIPSETLELSRD